MDATSHYPLLAAAAVRGHSLRYRLPLPEDLIDTPLEDLSQSQLDALWQQGSAWELKLYRFKRGHEDLPRVKQVLGFLRSVYPESLVDVGSGRGVFLFPFLESFPQCHVTSLDILDHRVEFLEDIHNRGLERLEARKGDVCTQPLPDNCADVVTLLEVLEHIPDVAQAVASAVRMARQYVVVSVPSKPDNNPEHIHLLTKDILTELFHAAGCSRLHLSGVNGHLILVASVN